MAYIDALTYVSHYAQVPVCFDRLASVASRIMDNETTGVDGVKKLKAAYPVDPDDDEAIKLCAAALVTFLDQVERVRSMTLEAGEYTKRADGSLVSKLVSSVSAGAESISYTTQGTTASPVMVAAANDDERKRMCQNIVREYLAGVCDGNGVHLLYMGVYPYVL